MQNSSGFYYLKILISGFINKFQNYAIWDKARLIYKLESFWDFSGSPVVKTSLSNARGVGSIPG